jgi:hypothetical protein
VICVLVRSHETDGVSLSVCVSVCMYVRDEQNSGVGVVVLVGNGCLRRARRIYREAQVCSEEAYFGDAAKSKIWWQAAGLATADHCACMRLLTRLTRCAIVSA